ncbi:MAG: Uma2 family endonuclease, partial [Vicinamibacteria bacterium]
VWRYDGNTLGIGLLQGKSYVESEASAAIPLLTADALFQFVEMSKTATRPQLLRAFRDRLRARR